ncbi:hypothetical protein FQN54_004232 [Arachnomyces sp. PD_36]|nr:hypothetical protein FQN54_004232 [Arachnomyces sp. PD_36]
MIWRRLGGLARPKVFLRAVLACRRYNSALSPLSDSPKAQIRLRDYQEECIQSVLSYLDKGHKRLGISLATGSGKTVIFTQLISRIAPRGDDGKQSLVLVHRRELVEQVFKHCKAAYPDSDIEIEMGNSHATGWADITIASVRSLVSKDRIEKFDPQKFKLVLVDEAHHIVAPSYLKVLEYFGLEKASPHSPALVGVSATFSRFDGLKLGAAIDHIVYHKDYIDMIGEKWLADAVFTTVKLHADLSGVADGPNGDFNPTQLSAAVNTANANDVTVRTWFSRASERKSTLVFCVDIEHVRCLTAAFRQHGIDARYITGETPKNIRAQTLDSFRNQEYPVLVNCGLFTEGTDIPNIDCVLLARPTRSKNLLVQMIGRGLRLHPGKENCHIIDFVASLDSGIVTAPTLLGLDPGEILDKTDAQEAKELRKPDSSVGEGSEVSRPQPSSDDDVSVSFTDYDSIHDLVQDSSGEAHIRTISKNAWVRVSEDRYVLTAPGGKLIIFGDGSDLFSVSHYRSLPSQGRTGKSPLARPRNIASSLEFLHAVHAADTFADNTFGSTFISLRQPWRRKDASPGQVAFLNKHILRQNPIGIHDITKGQAADMITKIVNGAKGRYSQIEAQKKRAKRAEEKVTKLQKLREREEVKLGPLE